MGDRDTQEKQHRQRGKGVPKDNASYSERVRPKRSWCAFKLGFMQLICKASLIFKPNLELALSIILKKEKIIWVKACCGWV